MIAKTTLAALVLLATLQLNALPMGDSGAAILSAKKLLEEAKDKNNRSKLREARAEFERLSLPKEMAWLADYYVAYADYRLAIYHMTQRDTAQQVRYLDHGIDRLDRCLEKNEEFADAYGLQATMMGQKIGANPALAMEVGMQLGAVMQDAIEHGPSNPRVSMFSAVNAYFTPAQFGGSKIRAREEMERASGLFEKENLKDKQLPDWGQDEALAWLARWQMEVDQNEEAEKTIARALQVNPKSGFARLVQTQLQERLTNK